MLPIQSLETHLDLWGTPAPSQGVQESDAAEEHVLSLITASKRGQVAPIGQAHCAVAIARTGRLALHLRRVLSPLPGLSVQRVHLS